MLWNNWLRPLASRIRNARRFQSRHHFRSTGSLHSRPAAPTRWYSSPRMRRALQRQDYFAALMQTERLEDRTLLTDWMQLGLDIDGEVAEDQSGFGVSLSADGSIVAIGARLNDDNGELGCYRSLPVLGKQC